jgi:hypothetical protein
VGSRHANCPMQRQSVRQRRTVAIPSAINADGTWNGCYPKTVMSINWRASLVPAAAVIPAPRAYTNIAAVKTLVVCLRAAGLLGGQPLSRWALVSGLGFCLGGAGFNPQRYVPAPNSFSDGENCSCQKPASLQAKAAYASHTGYGHKGTWPVPGRYPVHHRSPPSLTPWKTQCA